MPCQSYRKSKYSTPFCSQMPVHSCFNDKIKVYRYSILPSTSLEKESVSTLSHNSQCRPSYSEWGGCRWANFRQSETVSVGNILIGKLLGEKYGNLKHDISDKIVEKCGEITGSLLGIIADCISRAEPSRSQWLSSIRRGFATALFLGLRVRISSEHGCLSVVIVVDLHLTVAVSMTSRSLVQRSSTGGVSLCVI
jgi:hypothetical protein